MNIVVNKKALEEFIMKALNEVVDFHSANLDEIPAKEEEDGPILPSEQMAVQLSVEMPPVDDENYVPASIEELKNAASVISAEVPDQQIEFFYRKLHKLLDITLDRQDAGEREEYGRNLKDVQDSMGDQSQTVGEKQDSLKEAISRILDEQDSDRFTEDQVDNISVAKELIEDYLDSVHFGYSIRSGGMMGDYKVPLTKALMKYAFDDMFDPEDMDTNIFNELKDLSDEEKSRVISDLRSEYIKRGRSLPSKEEMARLRMNKQIDMSAKEMLKDQSPEEVAAELEKLGKKEKDPVKSASYFEIANIIRSKTKKEISPEEYGLDSEEDEDLDPVGPPKQEKDISDLWTQIAKVMGFSSAAGARQFAFKPLIKFMLQAEVIPESAMESIVRRAAMAFRRQIIALGNAGKLSSSEAMTLRRGAVIDPSITENEPFRDFFGIVFYQPFINEFLGTWKSYSRSVLADMGIDDQKDVIIKMLVGETSAEKPASKKKILSVMSQSDFNSARNKVRSYASNSDVVTKLASKFAIDRLSQEAKVKSAVKKSLSKNGYNV